jgi:NAD(P)-dependent dehydrogenase (short-subunit alcohol dehydrogenase family)
MMSSNAALPLAVISGACGGMGVACARVMGRHHRLVLTDMSAERLETLAQDLTTQGVLVDAVAAGDIAQPSTVAAVAGEIEAHGPLGALIHTAGLSPTLATWGPIVEVNLVATVRLLDAIEPGLRPGAAAVLIASMGGHYAAADLAIDALFDDPLDERLLARLEPLLRTQPGANGSHGLGTVAYAQSKRALLRLCQRRAAAWGARGARIVTISPGMISTPMARKEVAENPSARGIVERTPAGRWGSALDIANVAEFLASDLASFVSGSDVRVDGGLMATVGEAAGPGNVAQNGARAIPRGLRSQ